MNKRSLPEPNQWIIEQCQRLNFGQITFHVRSGEPDLARPWRTRRTVKLASGENGPRPEAELGDFELCEEQITLFSTLSKIKDGTCVTVEVKHGLPFIVEIDQNHEAA